MTIRPGVPVLARPRPGAARAYDTQVGLAAPTVLRGLGPDERRFVASLEGGRDITPGEATRFSGVLGKLEARGLLLDGSRQDGTLAAVIAIDGDAPFCRLIADTCAAAGLRVVPAADAPSRALVIVPFLGAPEAALAQRLVVDGTAHVLVACDEAGAWVSHVVTPGQTACARCRDIALTRADAAWPYLAAQLCGRAIATRAPAPPLLASPAAALRVAVRAAGWAASGEAGCGEQVMPDGGVALAPLVASPECGCGAAGPVGDELAARRARWDR